MLAAAQRTLNPPGEGSSPSGPTGRNALVVQRRGHRTRIAVTRVRVPPGALGLWQSGTPKRAHDVAAACRLAMAEVRVQLPLGALSKQDVGKPGIPRASGARERGFKSRRPDFHCGGIRAGTGRRLLTAPTQVRFLPPQPLRKGKPTGDGSRPESGRAMSLEGSTPSPSALLCPWPSGRGTGLPTRQGGFDSRRALWNAIGDRLVVGRLALNQETEVRPLLPELTRDHVCLQEKTMRDHPMAGCDALNVVMLVQVQLPQLHKRKSSGRMRSLS